MCPRERYIVCSLGSNDTEPLQNNVQNASIPSRVHSEGKTMEKPVLNIFISHRHEDNQAAVAVRDILVRYSGNQIKVFVSSDIPAGADWFECIRQQLIDSNLLLLLFTDKKLTWDWCLYEAGMFTRLEGDFYRRVICLHSPDLTPPEPLKHLQAVPGNTNEIIKFLGNLYSTNTYTQVDAPINSHLTDEELGRAASDIASYMVKKPRDVRQFSKHISLRILKPQDITPTSIPAGAAVEADGASLEIFDKLQGMWTWKDLENEALKNPDRRWLKELTNSIYRASQRSPVDPMFATFSARRGCKIYQPILYRADWEQDGSINFKILFQEETSWRMSDIPEAIAVLQTAQNMALRFRYEVLRKYMGPLTQPLKQVCLELREAIQNIEQEAASRGLLEEGKLLDAFEAPNDRSRIGAMYQDWYSIRAVLDDALTNERWDEIKGCLLKLRRYNSEFIPMAARRYEELMNKTIAGEVDPDIPNHVADSVANGSHFQRTRSAVGPRTKRRSKTSRSRSSNRRSGISSSTTISYGRR